jgi:hypothetical protein
VGASEQRSLSTGTGARAMHLGKRGVIPLLLRSLQNPHTRIKAVEIYLTSWNILRILDFPPFRKRMSVINPPNVEKRHSGLICVFIYFLILLVDFHLSFLPNSCELLSQSFKARKVLRDHLFQSFLFILEEIEASKLAQSHPPRNIAGQGPGPLPFSPASSHPLTSFCFVYLQSFMLILRIDILIPEGQFHRMIAFPQMGTTQA